ncbi:hypothetical protein BJI67_16360 (plasmid) [Acidihalobacter aeolianus]|uniref:Uncharacterized protein n=1 Tax=Acidihalobacter aeolianus TaxID=2792603 RepID=A0A1D8KCX2_9GAMM|nr:hypothetical protein BJI67_16360 [Acidihalobacter aeolianus]
MTRSHSLICGGIADPPHAAAPGIGLLTQATGNLREIATEVDRVGLFILAAVEVDHQRQAQQQLLELFGQRR